MIQTPNPPTPIRVVLADDHDLVRSGIKALLSTVDGVQVIAEARNGTELVALLDTVQPDIVMTDISMPGMNGWELAAKLRAIGQTAPILMLSANIGDCAAGIPAGGDHNDLLAKPVDFRQLHDRLAS